MAGELGKGGALWDTEPPRPPGPGTWGSAPGQPLRAPAAGPSCSVQPGLCLSPPHLGTSSLAGSSEFVPSIVISSFITLLLLSLLGILLVCTYIKKPVRPPSVLVRQPDARHREGAGCSSCWEAISRDEARLTPRFSLLPQKSFIKQHSLWVEQESSPSGSPDADSVQQLFLCQKEPQQDGVPSSSTGTAQPPLEKGWRLPAWPEDQACLLGTAGSRDSSCTSTDSGICLHASSSELSYSSGPEPQGDQRRLPAGDDSGVGLESACPRPTCSSGSGNASPTKGGQPHGAERGLSPAAAGQDSQQDVEFRGYLQQSKGTVEPRLDPAKGVALWSHAGPLQSPGSTDVVLDVECSELAVAKGYLKQSAPEHPCSHAQDLAPWGAAWEPTAWDFSSQVGPRTPALLSYGAPGAPLASKAGPELLKAPLDLSIFNTDLLGTLPLISSLSTNEWLTLQLNPLSLLNGDSKDSRL